MKILLLVAAVVVVIALVVGVGMVRSKFSGGVQTASGGESAPSLYDLTVDSLEGEPVDLARYRGKVALVVNVASKCGLTPQYEGLQTLYDQWKDRDFTILGFPSNDFMNQEPGDAEEIAAFCERNYGVSFPMFEKVRVKKGTDQHPVYQVLTEELEEPTWNFTKYVVDRQGRVVHRFAPKTEPDDAELRQTLEEMIEADDGSRS